MGRRADGGGTALYLKRIHSPFLILVYQRIGSVAAPNSTKKNGRNPYRLGRVRPRGVSIDRASRFVRRARPTGLAFLVI